MANAGLFRNGIKTSSYVLRLEEYLKQYFPEVHHNYNLPDIKRCNVDIYLPELNTVIEYDNLWFHRGKEESDKKKSQKILEKGYNLLRIIAMHKPAKFDWVLDQACSLIGYSEIHSGEEGVER